MSSSSHFVSVGDEGSRGQPEQRESEGVTTTSSTFMDQQAQVALAQLQQLSMQHTQTLSQPSQDIQQQMQSTETRAPIAERKACPCAAQHPGKSCYSFIIQSFGRAFYIAYGLRAGLSLALHLLKLLRTAPKKIFSLEDLVGVQGLPLDAVRIGLFFGCFTGLYNATKCALTRANKQLKPWMVVLSGTLAGTSLLFLERDTHRIISLYLFARVVQCWYNYQKQRGRFHLWGSNWAHGDSLLFAVTSAQVMYSYVMRPDTLPPSYLKFITDTGPITRQVLQFVRENNRNIPLDLQKLSAYVDPKQGKNAIPVLSVLAELNSKVGNTNAQIPPILPCCVLHPGRTCTHQVWYTWARASRRAFPIYLSVTFVPMILLRFWSLVRHPITNVIKGFLSAIRSTTFLAGFVTMYMTVICAQRNVTSRDHRIIYWIAGFIASWSILIEQKSRRSELALYVLPRALDSFYTLLNDRKWLSGIPNGDKLIFCASMGTIMYFREYYPENMAPLLKRLLNFFVPLASSLPSPPMSPQDLATQHAQLAPKPKPTMVHVVSDLNIGNISPHTLNNVHHEEKVIAIDISPEHNTSSPSNPTDADDVILTRLTQTREQIHTTHGAPVSFSATSASVTVVHHGEENVLIAASSHTDNNSSNSTAAALSVDSETLESDEQNGAEDDTPPAPSLIGTFSKGQSSTSSKNNKKKKKKK